MRHLTNTLHPDWLVIGACVCFIALLIATIVVIALLKGHRVTVGPGIRLTFVKDK